MLKKLIYPAAVILLAAVTIFIKGSATWIHFLNYLFLWNLPVAIISFFLFSVERKLWNSFRYSWKRFAIFFPEKKKEKLMREFHASSYTEMEELVREKYLYKEHDFPMNDYIFLPSALIFVSVLIYIFIIY